MARWQSDPSFYPSPRVAMKAPSEKLAYVAMFDPPCKESDAIAVVDVDPASSKYAKIVGQTFMPNVGDELHHWRRLGIPGCTPATEARKASM